MNSLKAIYKEHQLALLELDNASLNGWRGRGNTLHLAEDCAELTGVQMHTVAYVCDLAQDDNLCWDCGKDKEPLVQSYLHLKAYLKCFRADVLTVLPSISAQMRGLEVLYGHTTVLAKKNVWETLGKSQRETTETIQGLILNDWYELLYYFLPTQYHVDNTTAYSLVQKTVASPTAILQVLQEEFPVKQILPNANRLYLIGSVKQLMDNSAASETIIPDFKHPQKQQILEATFSFVRDGMLLEDALCTALALH